MILALLRHGHYEQPDRVPSGHLPHPLTSRGIEESKRAALLLKKASCDFGLPFAPLIYTSPLLRAYQTAQILAEELAGSDGPHLLVCEDQRLAERSLGAGANLTTDEIEQVLKRDPRYAAPPVGWKRKPDYRLPLLGAESLLDAGRRVVEALRDYTGRAAPKALHVVVGHGGAFRHAAYLLSVLQEEDVHRLSMFHAMPVYLERTELGTYRHHSGPFKVRDSAHGDPVSLHHDLD